MKILFIVQIILFSFQLKAAIGKPSDASLRCINMWDDGCSNGQLPGSGKDDNYINGGFNPGKRCVNVWDEGCVNEQLIGSGKDDDYVNGGFNPGKRCVDIWGRGCDTHFLGNNGPNQGWDKMRSRNPYEAIANYLRIHHI